MNMADAGWVWEGQGLDPGVHPSIFGVGEGAGFFGLSRALFLFHPTTPLALHKLSHLDEVVCDVSKWGFTDTEGGGSDSVNITGEACATGRPVYVFHPDGKSAKFDRFHDALRRYGATRPLPARFERLESWSYAPLDSATRIAREIERRWIAR